MGERGSNDIQTSSSGNKKNILVKSKSFSKLPFIPQVKKKKMKLYSSALNALLFFSRFTDLDF